MVYILLVILTTKLGGEVKELKVVDSRQQCVTLGIEYVYKYKKDDRKHDYKYVCVQDNDIQKEKTK